MLFRKSNSEMAKERAAAATALAAELARDKKFRKKLVGAATHGVRAQRRARRQIGTVAVARRFLADAKLRAELGQMARDLEAAWTRRQAKQTHRGRTLLLAAGAGGGVAAALPQSRRWISARADSIASDRPRTVSTDIEVEVPLSVAYNQWTQFEEFPKFMEGVEEVRQLDDTRLHWTAQVAGKRAEWDAKILEQHPDEQVSWISEDGKKTRGTVNFEQLGPTRTRVRLQLGYRTEGIREMLGAAVGLDRRRIRGDLNRFKAFIESRGSETGGWRGDIRSGSTTSAT
jgi:uncharacterized membrane protein